MNFLHPYPHGLDWQTHKNKSGIQIWWADVPNSSYKAIRGEMIVPHNAELCIHIIRDGSRLQDWVDGCCASAQLETMRETFANEGENTQFIAQLIYSVPWPFKNIISTEHNTLTWNSNNSAVHLHYQSAKPQHPSEKQHAKKCQPMLHTEGIWIVEKINDTESRISHTGFADPGGKIPPSLVNSSALSGQEVSFISLRKLLAQ